MAKKIKDLPKHMQYAYGAQPSPIAGAQLIFLNELTEMMEELRAEVAKISKSEDLSPAFESLASQFRQSITDLSAVVKSSKPKAQSLAPISKGLKQLAERPSSIREGQIDTLTERMDTLIETDRAILTEMNKTKEWVFDISRDSLDGHIVSVEARRKGGE